MPGLLNSVEHFIVGDALGIRDHWLVDPESSDVLELVKILLHRIRIVYFKSVGFEFGSVT